MTTDQRYAYDGTPLPQPGTTPLQRLRHTVAAFALDGLTRPERLLVRATKDLYPRAEDGIMFDRGGATVTGLTLGDLSALLDQLTAGGAAAPSTPSPRSASGPAVPAEQTTPAAADEPRRRARRARVNAAAAAQIPDHADALRGERPCLQLAGVQVSVYLDEDGALHVSANLQAADAHVWPSVDADLSCVPVTLEVNGATVWTGDDTGVERCTRDHHRGEAASPSTRGTA